MTKLTPAIALLAGVLWSDKVPTQPSEAFTMSLCRHLLWFREREMPAGVTSNPSLLGGKQVLSLELVDT